MRSVFSLLIDEVEARLKGETTLPAVGKWADIENKNIKVRDARYTHDPDEQQYLDEPTPGLIISPGDLARPATEGTNVMDDAHYHILVQIIDRSDQRFNRDRMDSHLLWAENIARTFHGHAPQEEQRGDSYPYLWWAEQVSKVDERMFHREELFVRGVLLRIRSREPRGAK